jgi:hypothetical protein
VLALGTAPDGKMAVNNGSSVRKMKRAENTPWQRTKVRNVTSIGRQDKSLAAAKSSLGARAERRLATAKGASGGESKKEIKPEPLTREQGIQENERKSAGTKTSWRAEWENRGSGVGKAGASDRKDETDRERLARAGMKNEAGAQLTRHENPEKIISTEKAKIPAPKPRPKAQTRPGAAGSRLKARGKQESLGGKKEKLMRKQEARHSIHEQEERPDLTGTHCLHERFPCPPLAPARE